jgi:hypothetical protein
MAGLKTPTLPAALESLSRSRRFWNHYFWEREDEAAEITYAELAERPLRFEVAPDWALPLSLNEGMSSMTLSIERDELAAEVVAVLVTRG